MTASAAAMRRYSVRAGLGERQTPCRGCQGNISPAHERYPSAADRLWHVQ